MRCIFRVFRVEASSVYASTSLSSPSLLFPSASVSATTDTDDNNNNKLCTLCLGILQFRFHGDNNNNNNNNIPLLISDMVKSKGYHSHHHSFSLEIYIPSIILNNDNTLRQYIKIKYGSRLCFKHNTTFISAKDAFMFSLLPPLQTLLGGCKSNQQDASFHIRLTCTASNKASDDNNNNNKRRKTGFSTFITLLLLPYNHFVFPSTHNFRHFYR